MKGVSTRGLKLLEFGVPLDSVGLSEEDVRFQLAKEDVQAGKAPVHVLVVNPQRKPPPHQIFPAVRSHIEGIDMLFPHLPRAALVEKLHDAVLATNFVLLSSPPFSGKTALLTLFHGRYWAAINCVLISLNNSDPASQTLSQHGIDVFKQKCLLGDDGAMTVVMLYDSQCQYDGKSFWTSLVEGSGSWITPNVRFVISTRHSVESEWMDCPVEFQSFKKVIMRGDLLLGDTEARRLLDLESGLPSRMRTPVVDEVIIRECAGHIGALRKFIDRVAKHFEKTFPQEQEVLVFYLSGPLVGTMGGLFGGYTAVTLTLSSELRDFLIKCFLNHSDTIPPPMEGDDRRCFTQLMEEGNIAQDADSVVTFTSLLAGRCCSKYLFPKRLGQC
ncbi:hypothetical protein V7S43_008583 [Phytophthora oleae]|uniref:Crinkler effector protein N-terminal domain-containing protein n=1 Tax=Phytophthora oleae TaxID=2107226 RepID=A0ABD3FJ55_9STRA